MAQLLDRYRRLFDGKEFAVISLGVAAQSSANRKHGRTLLLEAEDGEQVESRFSAGQTHGRFERIED